MRIRYPRLAARLGAVALGAAILGLLAACATAPQPAAKPQLVRVPADAKTISNAVSEVAPGGLVLVSPGTYHEAVRVKTAGITIRGTDRNTVVIDGKGLRPNGIVVSADGVTVQNLTVRSNTFYGVLVTGMPGGGTGHTGYAKLDPKKFPPVQRFRIDHVTAFDNGLYGIYAFDSQHGVIEDSYASGSADSGFYVGQCQHCDITVRNNIAENNAVGFENANASDSVYIVANRWAGNRVGMTLISSYQEAFAPQHGNTVMGNLIADNTSATSPEQAEGGFGIGIGISGGQRNTITGNRIAGNPHGGILIGNAEDIPATGNTITGNAFESNGVGVADISGTQAPSSGNCVGGGQGAKVLPVALAAAVCPKGSAKSTGVDSSALPSVSAPPGMVYLDVPAPAQQPGLTGEVTKRGMKLPRTVGEPDLSAVAMPPADFLAAAGR